LFALYWKKEKRLAQHLALPQAGDEWVHTGEEVKKKRRREAEKERDGNLTFSGLQEKGKKRKKKGGTSSKWANGLLRTKSDRGRKGKV